MIHYVILQFKYFEKCEKMNLRMKHGQNIFLFMYTVYTVHNTLLITLYNIFISYN